jgi:hypothetical protein
MFMWMMELAMEVALLEYFLVTRRKVLHIEGSVSDGITLRSTAASGGGFRHQKSKLLMRRTAI